MEKASFELQNFIVQCGQAFSVFLLWPSALPGFVESVTHARDYLPAFFLIASICSWSITSITGVSPLHALVCVPAHLLTILLSVSPISVCHPSAATNSLPHIYSAQACYNVLHNSVSLPLLIQLLHCLHPTAYMMLWKDCDKIDRKVEFRGYFLSEHSSEQADSNLPGNKLLIII